MLLDRGANPVARPGPKMELSTTANNGYKRLAQMMLKSLGRCGLAWEDWQQKSGFVGDLIKNTDQVQIKRALRHAYWRSLYPVPNQR